MRIAEKSTYFILWVSSIAYSLLVIFRLSRSLRPHLNDGYFDSGTLFHREKDVSDYEWDIWSPLILRLSFPYVLHLCVCLVLRSSKHEKLALLIRLILSVAAICSVLGLQLFVILFLKGLATFAVSRTRSKWLIWVTCLSILLYCRSEQFKTLTGLGNGDLHYIFSVTFAWCSMRSLSYALDVTGGANRSFSIFLDYYFYLPLFFVGPVITFDDFRRRKEGKDWSPNLWDFLQLLRYLFWYLVAEASIHFIYFNAIQYEERLVKFFGAWELAGLGYVMGQFFQLKYVFFYGYCGQFARLEGVPAAMPPICVGHVHLYSNMWRYFDRGLHIVLVKYIYSPIVSLHSSPLLKALASCVVFGYVYFWHGTYDFVLVWSVMNCLGVFVEAAARHVGKSSAYKAFQGKLSEDAHRRFLAFVSVPLFAVSMVSNFCFFFGMPVAGIFARKMLLNFDPVPFCTLYLLLYCGCQVSMEFSRVQAGRKKM